MRSLAKLALLSLLAIAAVELYFHLSRPAPTPAGVAAPGFTLRDVEGRDVSLRDLKGKVVAVNFWATWCGPCREEIPELAKLYSAHRGSCFELLGVAEESGGRDEIAATARRLGVNYPVLLDPSGEAGDAFRVPGYPHTFLVDAEGRLRKVFRGAVDRDELERALEPLLAEAPRSCPRA